MTFAELEQLLRLIGRDAPPTAYVEAKTAAGDPYRIEHRVVKAVGDTEEEATAAYLREFMAVTRGAAGVFWRTRPEIAANSTEWWIYSRIGVADELLLDLVAA